MNVPLITRDFIRQAGSVDVIEDVFPAPLLMPTITKTETLPRFKPPKA
jgi:hypothetical protein